MLLRDRRSRCPASAGIATTCSPPEALRREPAREGPRRQPRRDRGAHHADAAAPGHRDASSSSTPRTPARRAVREADEAVELHGDTAGRRLPGREQVVAACTPTGAEALHPGFGFLSENADFAEAVAARGGDVHRAAAGRDARDGRQDRRPSGWPRRRACRPCPAPTAPSRQSRTRRVAEADRIGYPVLVKASAGGGGKGMRIARDAADAARGVRARVRRGAGELRRRARVRRALHRAPAAHRGAGARRRARQRRAPRRARVLDPAPLPEGHRGVPVAVRRRGDARGDGRDARSRSRARSATSRRAPSR